MGWYDEFRIWNNSYPHSCVKSIVMPHGEVSGMWLPDVAVITADSFYELPKSSDYPVRLHSTGKVDFTPGGFVRYQCKMNLNLFPFDSMRCQARIESWFYTTVAQVFDKEMSSITTYNFTEHVQWRLEGYDIEFEDVYYADSGNVYSAINFYMYLTRKSKYYVLNIIIPSSLMSTLQLITFLLPPNQTIRIEVSFICLLAYTMFQSMIQEDLPKSADQAPLLSIYITMMIIYIAIAITCQCFVMTLTNKSIIGSRVPNWLLRYFKGIQAEYAIKNLPISPSEVRVNGDGDDTSLDQGIQDKHHPEAPPPLTSKRREMYAKIWKRLYLIIDRTAAVIYMILYVVTSVLLLYAVPNYFPNFSI